MAEDKSNTFNIPLSPRSYTPILVILLVVASFFLGTLYVRVKNLEQQVGQTGPIQATQSLKDTFVAYAKQAGLDTQKFTSCFDSGKYKQQILGEISQGDSLNVHGTPSFFINGVFVGGAFPISALKEVIDRQLSGTASTEVKDYSQILQGATSSGAFDPNPKSIEVGNAPVKGAKDAKVTMIEFSDFQCPYCSQEYPVVKQILSDYNGKVKLAYKDYPLDTSCNKNLNQQLHPNACKAAEAAQCANEQGKFWEYHDILFQNQSAWVNLTPIVNSTK